MPVIDAQPISAPLLNVKPRKSCGHHVHRFISGYRIISGMVRKPSKIATVESCINTQNPHNSKPPRNNIACFGVTRPLASGRPLVRSTPLSRSRSHKSLMTQPAARITIAPPKNRTRMYKSLLFTFITPPEASMIDHQAGNSNSEIPAGRSSRANKPYGFASSGK